jgi:flagellar protein FliL
MAEAQDEQEQPKKGGKLKLIIFSLVLVAAVGGGGFMLGGKGAATAAEPEAEHSEEAEHAEEKAAEHAVEGEVVLIEPVTLSLADGHYLKVGLALQLAPPDEEEAAAAEGGGHGGSAEDEPAMSAEETARAVDHAISLFGAHAMDDLQSPKERKAVKAELVEGLKEAYHGEVVDVYFTAFAMQ